MTWRSLQTQYAIHAYRSAPVTFIRRVLLGRDPYWRQYFWSRWGFVPAGVRQRARARKVLWIDALSGGEVTQVVSFCRLLRGALPDWAIVLSTNNKYSFDFARTHLAVDDIFDTPWDCPAPVRRALRRVQPSVFVCVQNVSCPVLVAEARRAGVTTVLVSGLMSKDVHRHPTLARAMELQPYASFDWVGAWGTDDVQGFVDRGVDRARIVTTGNMKFDFEFLNVSDNERRALQRSLQLDDAAPILLAASIHPGEEDLVGRGYVEARRAIPGLRLVVVPRYASDSGSMISTLEGLGIACVRRTELAGSAAQGDAAIVVDTFGELSRLYAIASVVFLGGTTYRRNVVGLGQNPIEPLAQRRPILFGQFMNLWGEITDGLVEIWPGVRITTAGDLADAAVQLLTNAPLARAFEQRIDALLESHRDDVARNARLVLQATGASSS